MKYYQVNTRRELYNIYYVAAESREQAEEVAWERFGEDIDRLRLEDCWEYETITEETQKDESDEWLMEDENGDFEYVEVK